MLRTFVFVFLFLISGFNANAQQTNNTPLPILSGVGGDFIGLGSDGKPFTFSDYYSDNIIMLFFGYTNCADVCPFTLGYLKQVYNLLSAEEQQQVKVVFVTIDPEYDTPEHLDEFVKFFNDNFIGVTGTKQQIDDIVALFQANYYKLSDNKVQTKNIRRVNEKEVDNKDTDEGDLYSHTVNVYLIDNQGRTRSLDFTGTDKSILVTKVRSLLAEKKGDKVQTENNIDNNQVAQQHEVTTTTLSSSNKITVQNHYIPAAPPNTRMMAGFGNIVNNTSGAIYFISAESDAFANIELHATEVSNGNAKMVKQENTLIKAGDFLAMQPGSYHLMLIKPKSPLKQDDNVNITLHFSSESGENFSEAIEFTVK